MTDARAVADEYQLGLEKMEAAGYEEFGSQIERHKIVIAALRAVPSPPVNVSREVLARTIQKIMFYSWSGDPSPLSYKCADAILSLPAIPSDGVLREALEGLLVYEKAKAQLGGWSDCTCMGHSRESESAYESGKCPHQIARAALASALPISNKK